MSECKRSDTRPAVGALPCPFCGSLDIHNWTSTDHYETGDTPSWSVMCFRCECEGPHCDEEDDALGLWNDRPKVKPDLTQGRLIASDDFPIYNQIQFDELKTEIAKWQDAYVRLAELAGVREIIEKLGR